MSEKITLQRVFDLAWHRFIVLVGQPAVEFSDSMGRYACRYVCADGRKCAIGLALPEGHDMQRTNQTADALVRVHPELWDLSQKEINAFGRIQAELHDNMVDKDTGEWAVPLFERRAVYEKIALEFDLRIPV